eukprot:GILI01003309.1.p1 GENE.GILI01003309.1~~GILI01003309.1.p1  ORF type:complete len:394 (-),score=46.58 GILI01003309.1:171-1313(-)
MQVPQEKQFTKCPMCSNGFETIEDFVRHLELRFELRQVSKEPVNTHTFESSDDAKKIVVKNFANFESKEAKCCEDALANGYNTWECDMCFTHGGINHLLHNALGRCPALPGCDVTTYPTTISNVNHLRKKEILPPPTLGPFTLIRELAKGGFSRVFLALNDKAEPLALKVPTTTKSQANEIQMLQTVTNIPHTAELLSFEKLFVDEEGTPKGEYVFAIAQRLYDGDLSNQRFPKKFLFEKLKDLAVTLTALWRERICHLDVKPANIFWRRSFSSVEAVLGDYDCATQFKSDDLSVNSSIRTGTAHFYPPEKSSEEIRNIDAKGWDAYSLGKSLELLKCDDEEVLSSQKMLMSNDPQIRIAEVVRLASMEEGCVTGQKEFF